MYLQLLVQPHNAKSRFSRPLCHRFQIQKDHVCLSTCLCGATLFRPTDAAGGVGHGGVQELCASLGLCATDFLEVNFATLYRLRLPNLTSRGTCTSRLHSALISRSRSPASFWNHLLTLVTLQR